MSDTTTPDKPMALVVRSLSVLTCLAQNPQGLALQQLHKTLDIPLGSMHRILATLEHERFVSRSVSTKRYILGSAARSLGQATSYDSYLVQPPAPVLDLGRRTGETVFLTQMVETRVVCVSMVESTHNLRLFVRVGQEMPLHAAASARVILAYKDPALVEALLSAYPREAFTTGTPRNVNHVIDRLSEVRDHGFEVCDNELDENVWAISAPVFDATGRVDFGVTLAAAQVRMHTPGSRAKATELVLRTAHALSTERGYRGPVPLSNLESLTRGFATSTSEHPLSSFPRVAAEVPL